MFSDFQRPQVDGAYLARLPGGLDRRRKRIEMNDRNEGDAVVHTRVNQGMALMHHLAYWINAASRSIRPVRCRDTLEMRRFIGGPIKTAWRFGERSFLYVDDRGFCKQQSNFFLIKSQPDRQPVPGNGLVIAADCARVGKDELSETGGLEVSLDELRQEIEFLDRVQADAWAAERWDEPAVTSGGHLLMTWGQVWSQMNEE
jgi:hypothetical protein